MEPNEIHLILLRGCMFLLLAPGVSSIQVTETTNEIYVTRTTQSIFFQSFSGSSSSLKSASSNALTDSQLQDQDSQHSNEVFDIHRLDTSNSLNDIAPHVTMGKNQPFFTKRNMLYEDTKYSSSSCYSFYEDQGMGINCSSLKLNYIPNDLPRNMTDLIFSNNELRSLNISSLFVYPKLAYLNAAKNRISEIITIFRGILPLYLKSLVLDRNSFKKLTGNMFENFLSLEILSIKHNKINFLKNSTFFGLFQLVILDVSWNSISHIESAAFDHMPKLRELYLNNNLNLGYHHKHLPPILFMNLKSLKILYLQGSSGGSFTYPNECLGYLRNLSQLNIDGLDDKIIFGSRVRNLKKLETLHISVGAKSVCHIKNLTNGFFKNVPYLVDVKFHYCPLQFISSLAFTNVPNLKHLYIAFTFGFGVTKALGSLQSLQNSSLVSLSLIGKRDYIGPCMYLRGEDAKYITNINLEFLDLSANHLAMIQKDFVRALPKTLKSLILRDNKFTTNTFHLRMISTLRNLEKLDLTYQNIGHHIRLYSKDKDHNEQVTLDHYEDDQDNLCREQEQDQSFSPHTKRHSLPQTGILLNDDIEHHDCQIPLPVIPKLKVLWAPSFTFYMWLFRSHNFSQVLEEVDFSYNFVYMWGISRFPHSVKNASLVGNYCRRIKPNFFPRNNALISLNISDNLLGPQFGNDNKGDIFRWLSKVRHLDIRMNLISFLPHNFFKGLTNLKTLLLSDNRLQSLNLTLSHMKHLEFVDARRNSIVWIGRKTRYDLDVIALNHPVSLDLRENPLLCTCDGLEILSWLKNTRILLVGEHFLKCRFENGHHGYIGNMTQQFDSLQRKCRPTWVKLLPCIVSLCAITVAMTIFVIFRCRWKIKYLAVVKLSTLLGLQSHRASNYKFDAYIVYAEEDRDFVRETIVHELESKRKHRLCVADRDFIPGSIIDADITVAIQSSNRTIAVISPEFLEDDNAVSIQMALCEERYTKRSVLELFMYKPIEENDIKADLLVVLKNNKFVTYPEGDMSDDRIRESFWETLSETIGHTENQCEPRHDFN